MGNGKLSKKDYQELLETARKIVRYEKGEKVDGYTRVLRPVVKASIASVSMPARKKK